MILTKTSQKNYDDITKFIEENKEMYNYINQIAQKVSKTLPKKYYSILDFYNEEIKKIKNIKKEKITKQNNISLVNNNTINHKEFIKLDTYCLIKFECLKIKFALYVYYDSNTIKNISDYILLILFRIIGTTYISTESVTFKNVQKLNKEITVSLYLHNLNRNTSFRIKKLNKKNINEKNINKQDVIEQINILSYQGCYNCASGYTRKSSNITIVCTKLPELCGLLTHELLHLFGLDLCNWYTDNGTLVLSEPINDDINKILKQICKRYSINSILLYEVFCNTNTTILHSLFNALEIYKNKDKNKDKNKVNSRTVEKKLIVNKFIKILTIEMLYSIYHSAKIVYFIGYDNFDFFTKENVFYYQKAALFEYTIMRSFLLQIVDKYLDIFQNSLFCLKDNKSKEVTKIVLLLYLMLNDNSNENIKNVTKRYENMFNWFMKLISDKSKTMDYCTEEYKCMQNMEYFCIDLVP